MNYHVPTARFDNAQALSEDELRRNVPSIFATQAHPSRSDRFAPIPTIEILREMKKEGFVVVGARQCVARTPDRGPFAKHLLRIRNLDEQKNNRVGDTVFEMLMKNANDGSCQWDLMGALFKILCLNSMVAALPTLDAIKVRHFGKNVSHKVIEGTFRVMNEGVKAIEAPVEWSKINLNRDEQVAFAESARVLRFGDAEGNVTSPITAEALLIPRRVEDHKPDLWSTFNVLQENLIKGGVHGSGPNANGQIRNVTTRPIKGIDQDVKLNRGLWLLASKMRDLKVAA